jgi:two-component system, NarL family, invasion response regulator UvrY
MTGSPPGRTLRGVMSPVGVIAVDHHEAFRRAARTSVSGVAGFEFLAEAASAEEAIEIAVTLRPALALVEVHMPGIDGLETARRLTRAVPDLVVVLVSADAAPDEGEVVSSGAAAFLTKDELTPSALRALWAQYGPG